MEQKYLKYKHKYLNLKNIVGGISNLTNKTYNFLIVTHNARIRCLFEDIAHDIMNKYRESIPNSKKNNEIRFKNCAIIKFSFTQTDIVSIEMIYEGFVNNRKGIYFTINNNSDNMNSNFENNTPITITSNGDIIFNKIFINISKFGIDKKFLKNNNFNIYLVRHGEATHNISKVNINLDTSLTEEGIEQAKKAGEALFNNGIKTFDCYFASKLYRTRQTLSIINDKIIELQKLIEPNKKRIIIILPCSHELSYNENGSCDYKNRGKLIAPENITNCNGNKCDIKTPGKCCIIANYVSDWTFYNIFYTKKNHCSDTNMLKLAIQYKNADTDIK